MVYVQVDFERDPFGAALQRAGFNPSRPTLFILEGVLMYLQPSAVEAAFSYISTCAPGTFVAANFLGEELKAAPGVAGARRRFAEQSGEPFKTFCPAGAAATNKWLQELHPRMKLLHHVPAKDIDEHVLGRAAARAHPGAPRLAVTPPGGYHLALLRVSP